MAAMKKAPAAALLALVLLAGPASALVVITVGQQEYHEDFYVEPQGETYALSLASTIFDQPVYNANVAFNFGMGTVSANQVVHVQTDWTLRGDAAYYVNVSMRSFGEKHWTGFSQQQTSVFVNGTAAWQTLPRSTGAAGSHFDYEQTHMIKYAENVTAILPAASNGDAIWDWAAAPALTGGTDGGRIPTTRVDGVDGWFFIRDFEAGLAFRSENSSSDINHYWLANGTHGDEWTVQTSYQDRLPDDLTVSTEFHEELSFFADVASGEECGGIARFFLKLVGVCPTILSVVSWAVGLIPNVLAFFVDFVSPEGANFLEMAGEVAGEFVGTIVFTFSLLSLAPGKLFVVLIATASGAANLIGALKGDLGEVLRLNWKFISIVFIAVFWYFYLYFLLAKLAVETIIKIVDTIGNYVPFT